MARHLTPNLYSMPRTPTAKSLLVLAALTCIPLAGVCSVLAKALPTSAPDTLIPAHVPYRGYRLHVRDAQLVKQRRDRYLVAVTVVNTGSRAVGLGPGFPVHFLQTDFDEALAQSGLLPLAPGIRRALIEAAVTLEAAATLPRLELWVTPSAPPRAPLAKTDDIAPAYRERLPRRAEPEGNGDEAGEAALYASAKPVSATPASRPEVADCTDLRIGAVEILQRDRRSALVALTIVNEGDRALTRETLGTGATLDVYLGGSDDVTAASERLARVNLSSRIGSSLGKGLATGGSIKVTERLDLSSLSRYTRVLVAQLDPGQVVPECDETNNETSTVLKR